MKLTVLVSSNQYLTSAGNRIRYQRLREPLARQGCMLDIQSIDSLSAQPRSFDGEIFLFSKVQDARGLALARHLRSQGAFIGVDLFDDYFSQVEDPRFAQQRQWLKKMAVCCDFFICSTECMYQIAKPYFGNIPGHILDDPFEEWHPHQLARRLTEKRQLALATKTITVLWYGMGDNPNFPVGLHDLARYGHILNDFERSGFSIQLKILTNERALDRAGLAKLRQLPIRPEIEEWTEERETTLLNENLVSFLPVNAQRFSIAKSLNRAITALTGGTQLLSSGYPLYAPLDAFLYRDGKSLIADLMSDNLRISPATLDALDVRLNEIASPGIAAQALLSFFSSFSSKLAMVSASHPSRQPVKLAILHGERSSGAIHKFARQREWLSLGSPYTPLGLPYDAHLAIFEPGAPCSLRLSAHAAEMLSPKFGERAKSIKTKEGFTKELKSSDFGSSIDILLSALSKAKHNSGAKIALHSRIIESTRAVYEELLGPLEVVESELNPLLYQSQELEVHSAWVQ